MDQALSEILPEGDGEANAAVAAGEHGAGGEPGVAGTAAAEASEIGGE